MKEWLYSVVTIAVFGFCTAFLMNLSFITFNYDMLIMKKTLLVNALEAQDGVGGLYGSTNPVKPLDIITEIKDDGYTFSKKLGGSAATNYIVSVNSKSGHYYEFILQKDVDFLFGFKVPVNAYGRTGILLNGEHNR